jgi:hypothetical protein
MRLSSICGLHGDDTEQDLLSYNVVNERGKPPNYKTSQREKVPATKRPTPQNFPATRHTKYKIPQAFASGKPAGTTFRQWLQYFACGKPVLLTNNDSNMLPHRWMSTSLDILSPLDRRCVDTTKIGEFSKKKPRFIISMTVTKRGILTYFKGFPHTRKTLWTVF